MVKYRIFCFSLGGRVHFWRLMPGEVDSNISSSFIYLIIFVIIPYKNNVLIYWGGGVLKDCRRRGHLKCLLKWWPNDCTSPKCIFYIFIVSMQLHLALTTMLPSLCSGSIVLLSQVTWANPRFGKVTLNRARLHLCQSIACPRSQRYFNTASRKIALQKYSKTT